MFPRKFIALIAFVALVTMACGINLSMPESQIKTGETVEEDISVPLTTVDETIDLTLSFGAGKLEINPGAEESLVEGTATYNVADFKPTIQQDGSEVKIEQGNLNINGIPSFEKEIENEWDLKLNEQTPLNLKISAGAYTGRYELGGLSLKRLEISDGAADVNLSFSDPNPVELDSFDYTTGASSVQLEELGNANLVVMTFRSGAGSYRLDFSGDLRRDAEVVVESGISSVVIVVPDGVPAEVTFEGGISNVNRFGKWEKSGNSYILSGSGPGIKITVKMGAGNLELRNR